MSAADIEVFVSKGIWDVPADSAKLSTVLNNSMEEREAEKKFLVRPWVTAVIQSFVVETFIILEQVLAETSWRLHRHFYGCLQHGNRERC